MPAREREKQPNNAMLEAITMRLGRGKQQFLAEEEGEEENTSSNLQLRREK